jgi:signal peptidase I
MISYFTVKGHSMEPLCKEGDFVVLDKISYFMFRPLPGDIVVLRHPQENRLLLKYILQERTENGKRLYWVEGLNKNQSSDSRSFGWILREMILGKAVMIRKQKHPAAVSRYQRAAY